jgi:flagellar basal-body rod protein FlgB
MAITFSKALGVHQKTLGIRSRRAEVLSSNIANADTPHYKAKDVDFAETLENSKRKILGVGLNRTNVKHFGHEPEPMYEVKYRVPLQPDTGDGNTVDMATERNHFVKNSMEYQTTFNFLNGRFSGMKKSIRGKL